MYHFPEKSDCNKYEGYTTKGKLGLRLKKINKNLRNKGICWCNQYYHRTEDVGHQPLMLHNRELEPRTWNYSKALISSSPD